ncbi:hypothetical protein AMECASPLE_029335 [Ameca splendens]|uniref:Uncharacterized protein n=1 Tax=Ameca splendens TaxID=208324 RepID=A0ABV0Y5Y5_9TELE
MAELLKSLLMRFTKRELLHDVTPLQIEQLDITNTQPRVNPRAVDIGIRPESFLKELHWQNRPIVGEFSVLQFKKVCVGGSIQNGEEDSGEEPLDFETDDMS